MSSTNRSNARDLHIADYYRTPIKDIETFLNSMNYDINIDWNNVLILDPTAGGSETEEMSYPVAIEKTFGKCNIKTIDIRDDSRAETKGNYLEMSLDYKPNVIITNPPFNQAIEVIKKSIEDVEDGGYVIMLLRLNFLETKARKEFFDNYMPSYIYVYHRRLSFVEGKGSDSVAYAHFIWKKGSYPEFAKIKVI